MDMSVCFQPRTNGAGACAVSTANIILWAGPRLILLHATCFNIFCLESIITKFRSYMSSDM